MDNIFSAFWSLTTVVMVVGCFAATWLTRRGIETGVPSLKPLKQDKAEVYKTEVARWWNSFILYLIPPAWGVALGYLFFNHLEWPKGFETYQATMFFGMVCGWVSGLLYKFLVKAFLKKMGATDKEAEEAIASPRSDTLRKVAKAREATKDA